MDAWNWNSDQFEDLMARGIIALHESKLHKMSKGKNAPPHQRVGRKQLFRLLKNGAYIAPEDRLIDIAGIDILVDGLPNLAIWATKNANVFHDDTSLEEYLVINYAERIKEPDIGWRLQKPGAVFRVTEVAPTQSGGLFAVKANYSVDSDGLIWPARYTLRFKDQYNRNVKEEFHGFVTEEECKDNEDLCTRSRIHLAGALGFWQDRVHLWNVLAVEGTAKVMFGVYEDQIKSLFYSREAPRTDTGRKSPILHWVRSHRRRVKSGVDIDVKKHLRGTSTFEMNGTRFEISRPLKRKPQ